MTLEKLTRIVSDKHRTNMKSSDAKAKMQDLFASYDTILCRNGLIRLNQENQKVAVYYVLSAVRLTILKEILESDHDFSHHSLGKDIKVFCVMP